MADIAYDFFKQKLQLVRNEVIFRQDVKADYIYIVKKGTVLIYREEPITKKRFNHKIISGFKNKKIFSLGKIERGGIIGEECILK